MTSEPICYVHEHCKRPAFRRIGSFMILVFAGHARILFLLSGMFLAGSSFAQEASFFSLKDPQPRFVGYSVAQGLPSSETYYVHQDRRGYIWFCTDRGVVRFDGYRFTVFSETNGLADNVVYHIYEDYKGRIWFLSDKPKLCYYEYLPTGQAGGKGSSGKIVPYRYNHLIGKALKGYNTAGKDLYINPRNGDLTYSVYNTMAFRISEKGTITITAPFENQLVEIWEADRETHYYLTVDKRRRGISTKAGFEIQYRKGNQVFRFKSPVSVLNNFRLVRHKDAIFYGTNNSLMMLRDGKSVLLSKEGPVTALCSVDNYLWVGFAGGGVRKYRLDARRNVLHETDHLLHTLSVTKVIKDREGGYWFSTLEDGVKYMPHLDIRHLTKREGLISSYITAIAGIGNTVYAISNHRRLQRISRPSWTFTSSHHLNFGMGVFRGELLLTGCDSIPAACNGDRIRLIGTTANIRRIFTSDDYYIISRFGISRFDYNHREEVIMERGDQVPYFKSRILMEDKYRRIYLGNELGLFVLRNKRLEPVTFNGLLKDVRIEDLYEHRAFGSIVATRGKGLVFFDGEHVTGHLTAADGLLSDQLSFCYVDARDRLWVGSNKGLNCIVKRGQEYDIRQFTIRNGLLTNEVSGLYEYNNRIWIATKKGISIMDLVSYGSTGQPGIFLEEIRGSGNGKVRQQSPVFASGTNFVKLVLRTTNYRGASFHRFRYRFSSESEWATSNDPEITLNNPKHGDYHFEVSYLDDNGHWSTPRLMCTFAIEAPFYVTWYFVTGLVIIGILLGFLLFRLRIRQLSRRHQLQKTINQLEQKALRAQMNPHFIFNSLNSIQSFLIYEENEKAERYLLKFAHLIRQTLNNSRESYITIESEMETLRRYLELEQMRFKDKFGFEIVCRLSPDELKYGVPPMLIQPYVENAVLHGFRSIEAGGKILVIFESMQNNRLLCTVEDNGVGRKATERKQGSDHKSFGTRITAERLEAFREKYGDDFTITTIDKMEDGVATGTKVVIQVPVVPPQEITSNEE